MLSHFSTTDLAAFAALAVISSAAFVHVSGYVTAGGIRPKLLVAINAALVATLTVLTIVVGWRGLDWSIAVVVAGSAFLIAPFLVQPLPAFLRDGTAGLVAFGALGVLGLFIAYTAF